MRITPCFIDSAIVESRCDHRLRRYLMVRDATLKLPNREAITANVVITGIDCDHFGPLLRAGQTISADVIEEDGCYFLTDPLRRQHADDRAYARQQALETERARVADARELAGLMIGRALRG